MTPLTSAAVQALAQQAAEAPAHLDLSPVQQVCQEWLDAMQHIADTEIQRDCYRADADRAESALAAARAALQAVLEWGVEMDDTRLGYVVVQVDREAIAQVRAALGLTQGEGQ